MDLSQFGQRNKEKYSQFLFEDKLEFQENKVQNKENQNPSQRQSPLMRKSISPMRKKLNKEATLALIQEIYTQKFQDASVQIQQKSKVNEDFNQYVQKFTRDRLIDINGSLAIINDHVTLFKKFMNKDYEEEDLMYYLFVRAIVEKEIGQQIYSRAQVVELQTKVLIPKQIENIIHTVFGFDQEQEIEQLMQLCNQKMTNKKMNAFEFMLLALEKYYKDRNPESLQQLVIKTVFELIDRFFADNYGTIPSDKYKQVQSIINDLLNAIFKFDKRIWFQRVQPKPDDLLFMENLQKQYKKLQKDELVLFSKRILQTPQLAKCLAQIID
ncbi:hypothetical protein pb186bvf_013660 [Paramecium bursaria]